jgi:hypothetical protein
LGFERSRLPYFLDNRLTDGGEIVSFTRRPPFTPQEACGITIGVAKKAVRDWTNRNHKKILGIHNWTQTGKTTFIRDLCKKNEGSV